MRTMVIASNMIFDIDKIQNELVQLPLGTIVVYPKCDWASSQIAKIAEEIKLETDEWNLQDYTIQDLIESDIDLCIVFSKNECKETQHVLRKCRASKIETQVVN